MHRCAWTQPRVSTRVDTRQRYPHTLHADTYQRCPQTLRVDTHNRRYVVELVQFSEGPQGRGDIRAFLVSLEVFSDTIR